MRCSAVCSVLDSPTGSGEATKIANKHKNSFGKLLLVMLVGKLDGRLKRFMTCASCGTNAFPIFPRANVSPCVFSIARLPAGATFLFGCLQFQSDLREQGSVEYDASDLQLSLTLKRATVTIERADQDDHVEMDYVVYQYDGAVLGREGEFRTSAEGNSRNIHITDGTLTLRLGSTALAALRISGDGGERLNDVDITNVEVDGPVSFLGTNLNVQASRLTVRSLAANITEGDLILRNFSATDRDAGVNIQVMDGDVVLSPLRGAVDAVNLRWKSPCGYVCLPHGQYVQDDHCHAPNGDAIPDLINETMGTVRSCMLRNCSGYYPDVRLMANDATLGSSFASYVPDSSRAAATSSFLNADIFVLVGNIYIHDDIAESTMVGRQASAFEHMLGSRIGGRTVPVQLSDIFAADLREYVNNIDAFQDSLGMVELPTLLHDAYCKDLDTAVHLEPASNTRLVTPGIASLADAKCSTHRPPTTARRRRGTPFGSLARAPCGRPRSLVDLYSTKKVYSEIMPGVLSVVSGSLLAPITGRIQGRLNPGFCPYQFHPSENRIGQASSAIEVELGMLSSNGTDLIGDESANLLTLRNRSGIFGMALHYEQRFADIFVQYSIQEVAMHETAYAVIGMSIVLAILIGILLAYRLVVVLDESIQAQKTSVALTSKVLKFRNSLEQPQEVASNVTAAGGNDISTNALISKTEERLHRLLKREKEQEAKGRGIYGLLALERSFFQVGELIYTTISGARRNSLEEFAQKFKIDRAASLVSEGVPRLEFIDQYELYCLEHNLKSKNVVNNMAYLESIGLFSDLVVGNATEQFLRMKFKPTADIQPLPDHSNPADSSLDLFIDSEIALTPFETDSIAVAVFRTRYENFLAKHGLKEHPITPRALERYSSRFVRKGLTYFRCIPEKHLNTHKTGVSDWMSRHVVDKFRWFWGAICGYEILNALLKVLVHVVSVVTLTVPMLWTAVHWQNQSALYALPGRKLFANMDLMLGINLESQDEGELQDFSVNIILLALLYYGLAFIELIHHYIFEAPSNQSDVTDSVELPFSNQSSNSVLGGAAGRILHIAYVTVFRAPFHIMAFLFAAGAMTVVSLCILWAIIGAVINPVVFLPYAAAAGTVVFVTATQHSSYWALRDVNEKRVKALISNRIQMLLRAQRNTSSVEQNKREGDGDGDDSDKFLDRRSKQELAKFFAETGLTRDDIDVIGLAQGKATAVNVLAVQLGVDVNVLQLIVSLARRDQDALLEAAAELGPKLGVKGPAARSIVNLANSFSKESGRQGIKMLVNTLTESTASKDAFILLGDGSPFSDASDPDIDTTLQILPEIAESMLAITEDNDFEPFCELINENKIIRDAFKPFPMQVFRFLQDTFAQNDAGIRKSLLRVCERLLIADACTLKLKGSKNKLGLSRVIEHLGDKLGTQRQLSTVLATIFGAQRSSERNITGSMWAALKASELGAKLGPVEASMVKALCDNVTSVPTSVRPVQSVKAWVLGKTVVDGIIPKESGQYIPMYQIMSLLDGLFCVWTQSPSELAEAEQFCRQVLTLEPDVAAALLALMTSVEGGVNPDTSATATNESMEKRITQPLCRQLAEDFGAPPRPSTATQIPLLGQQLSQAFGACIAISRGRAIDFTKFVLTAGIPRGAGAEIIGQLMCGQLQAPLWRQMTPLCNMLGISDSSIICAVMQLRRQAVMGDYVLGTDTLLPWLGIVDSDVHSACRWILQLAISRKPTHVQRAMINVLEGAERGPAVRSMSMILCRRRRQCLPGDGPWYVDDKSIDPHDAATVIHEIKNTAVDVLPDGEDDPAIIQVLTRIKMVEELDAVLGRAVFTRWCETRYAHLPKFSSATASKLFDLITFLIQVCSLR